MKVIFSPLIRCIEIIFQFRMLSIYFTFRLPSLRVLDGAAAAECVRSAD
jgi:hypothetical protein